MKGELVNIHLLGNVFLMLILMIGAVFVLAFLLKKMKKISPSLHQDLEVIGARGLSTKSKVFLIEARDTHILVGVSDSHIQTLHVFEKNQKI